MFWQRMESNFIKTLPQYIQDSIRDGGIRNSHLLSIAPTGTISLTADNVSSGIEPPYSLNTQRPIQTFEGPVTVSVKDYAYHKFNVKGKIAEEVTVEEHLAVLAAASKYVDSAVSKTCNVGGDVTYQEFKDIYLNAWKAGCKGITTFRAAGSRFGLLKSAEDPKACYIDPETGSKTCD